MILTHYPHSLYKATDTTQDLTWEQVVSLLTNHDRRDDKEGPGFSPASFLPTCECLRDNCPGEKGHALNINVIEVHVLLIDLDKGEAGGTLTHLEALEHLTHVKSLGVAACFHSSHSYAPPAKSTWRLAVRLSRPVLRDEFNHFQKAAVAWLGIPSGIKSDFPARFWHLPSCPPTSEPQSGQFEGEPLDVDAILAGYVPDSRVLNTREVQAEHDMPPASEALLAEATSRLERHGQHIQGESADSHTYIAGALLTNNYALSYQEALPIFEAWNAKNQPPWDDEALQKKLDAVPDLDVYGHDRSAFEFQARMEARGIVPEIIVDTTPGKTEAQVPEVTAEPGTWAHEVQTAKRDLTESLNTEAAQTLPPPFFSCATEFMSRDFPTTQWLITGIMTQGGVSALATEPKAAKTWAATEEAIAIATGTKCFDEFDTLKGGVAYFYAEDMGQAIRNRIRALCNDRKGREDISNLYLCPRGRDLDICNDDSLALMLASARQIANLKLLVLDPFRDVHGGAEDSSDEMSAVMRRLRILGTLLGCGIMFVHHSAKAGGDTSTRRGGQKMRGSGAIHGSTDNGMYLSGLSGNGENEFTNRVDVEVKGAKSAGGFNLTLNIVDDAHGAAIDAKWTITRGATGGADEGVSEIIDCVGNAELRHDRPPKSKDILRVVKGTKVALEKNLQVADELGYIEKKMNGLVACGWVLTNQGRTIFKESISDP